MSDSAVLMDVELLSASEFVSWVAALLSEFESTGIRELTSTFAFASIGVGVGVGDAVAFGVGVGVAVPDATGCAFPASTFTVADNLRFLGGRHTVSVHAMYRTVALIICSPGCVSALTVNGALKTALPEYVSVFMLKLGS